MYLFQVKKIISITIAVMCMMPYIASSKENNVKLKYDFESLKNIKSWKGWSTSPQKIKIVKNDIGGSALQLTARGWNTAIIDLKPPFVVAPTSALRFKVKTSRTGSWEINLSNGSEKALYVTSFSVGQKNKWTSVLILLKNAAHKKGGKAGIPHDGMIGDKLTRIQIAFHGKKILIDDFEIINLSPDDKNIKNIPKLSKTKTNFKNSKLEFFFPYGVILNYSQGMKPTAKLMGQSLERMFKRSLQDIRMHHMNLISPFCSGASDLPIQIAEAKKMGLKIFPTTYLKPWTPKKLKAMQKYKNESTIVAWYWTDEPGPGLIKDFKLDMVALKKVDTNHPMAMAICSRPSVTTYAPYLDITCIDPYPIFWSSGSKISDIDSWMTFTRKYAKGRIWAIPQAFSNKTYKRGDSAMPSATEIRALSWSAVAGGAAGLVYFIYDSHPYMNPKYIKEVEKGRELICGLKDGIRRPRKAWHELGRLGETLPSIGQILLGAEVDSLKKIKWQYAWTRKRVRGYLRTDKIKKRQYLVFFNENTLSSNEVLVKFPKCEKNTVLLDLATLSKVSMKGKTQHKFILQPGDGVCFFLGEKDKAKQITAELEEIRLQDWRKMTEVKLEKYRPWLKNIEEYQIKLTDIQTCKEMKALYYQIDDKLSENSRYQSAKKLIYNTRELIGSILDKTFNSRFIFENDHDASLYPDKAVIACAQALGKCELAFEANSSNLEMKIKILKEKMLQLKQSWE